MCSPFSRRGERGCDQCGNWIALFHCERAVQYRGSIESRRRPGVLLQSWRHRKGYGGIEGYRLNTSTGALTAVSGSPFTSLDIGYLGQFDQSGAFLSVYGSGPVLGILDVGSSGALTQPIPSVDLTETGPWVITDAN